MDLHWCARGRWGPVGFTPVSGGPPACKVEAWCGRGSSGGTSWAARLEDPSEVASAQGWDLGDLGILSPPSWGLLCDVWQARQSLLSAAARGSAFHLPRAVNKSRNRCEPGLGPEGSGLGLSPNSCGPGHYQEWTWGLEIEILGARPRRRGWGGALPERRGGCGGPLGAAQITTLPQARLVACVSCEHVPTVTAPVPL